MAIPSDPGDEQPPDTHSQLEDLLGAVRREERNADLDDRLALQWDHDAAQRRIEELRRQTDHHQVGD